MFLECMVFVLLHISSYSAGDSLNPEFNFGDSCCFPGQRATGTVADLFTEDILMLARIDRNGLMFSQYGVEISWSRFGLSCRVPQFSGVNISDICCTNLMESDRPEPGLGYMTFDTIQNAGASRVDETGTALVMLHSALGLGCNMARYVLELRDSSNTFFIRAVGTVFPPEDTRFLLDKLGHTREIEKIKEKLR